MARSYRFITCKIDKEELLSMETGGNSVISEKEEPDIFYQLSRVLRARPGDGVILQANSDSPPVFQYLFRIRELKKNGIPVEFISKEINGNELGFQLNLWVCLPNKPDKLEMIIQKAVELGASKIFLFESDFSQFKHNLRMERLEKIAWEAAEQAERAIVPEVTEKGKLGNFINGAADNEIKNVLVAMERADTKPLNLTLSDFSGSKEISILVGPEGGFSENEKILIKEKGLTTFSLGKRILRMETAVIMALGLAGLIKK